MCSAMAELQVYQLCFVDRPHLEVAFSILLDSEDVPSCSVEPGTATIRFIATRKVADPLLERFYADRGLAWCSGHRIRQGV